MTVFNQYYTVESDTVRQWKSLQRIEEVEQGTKWVEGTIVMKRAVLKPGERIMDTCGLIASYIERLRQKLDYTSSHGNVKLLDYKVEVRHLLDATEKLLLAPRQN